MDWYQTVFELIDTRSFSNMWYWIALAVLWSTVSHWVLGVPFDMVQRAQRQGGQAEADLEDLVRVNINRILYIQEYAGLFILGFGCAAYTTLALLGFFYGVEFAQAVFLLAFPMMVIALMSLNTARRIRSDGLAGADLRKRMARHRFWTQVLGVVSIFVTAVFGMFQNVVVTGPL
ncbi:MAG: component of SufBCD complex [Pseudomonadota bacterium]